MKTLKQALSQTYHLAHCQKQAQRKQASC